MGNVVVVGKPKVGPSGIADQNRASGFLTLSASYAAGGDALDPMQLGLSTVDELYLTAPGKTDGSALTTTIVPVVRSLMPQRTAAFGGSGGILIQAFDFAGAEVTGDQSGFLIPFLAFGT